jgi:hypothetical protein
LFGAWLGISWFQVEALLPKDFAKLAVHMPPELAALLAHPEQLDPVKIPAGGWLGGLEVGGWGLQWDGDVFEWIARHLSMGYTNIYIYMYVYVYAQF